MSQTNPKADAYVKRQKQWQEEVEKLRSIALSCPVTEELKWGCPCYTHDGNNIVLIHTFKNYCALLFFKGALFKDPKNLLVQQTKNVQAARQLRFTSVAEVAKQEKAIKGFIKQAIEVEKAGLKVESKKTSEFDMPEEFRKALDANPALKDAFDALTPGRQRGYLLHFAGAKQSKTRAARVEKHIPRILDGLGLHD